MFEHAWELFNLIGHGVVMEGNRKMTGCLQTFGLYICTWYLNISGKGVEVAKLCNLLLVSVVKQNFSKWDLYIVSWKRSSLWDELLIVSLSKIVPPQNFRIFLRFQKLQVFLCFPLDHIVWLVTNHLLAAALSGGLKPAEHCVFINMVK